MFEAITRRILVLVFLVLVILSPGATGQKLTPIGEKTEPPRSSNDPAALVQATLIGVYHPDGSFHATHRSRPSSDPNQMRVDQSVIPPAFQLHSNERVVENLAPPMRATRPVRVHSTIGSLFDDFLTCAYGREIVLKQPTKMTTDSRGRLIVADSKLRAVHVLDIDNNGSFRIAGGPKRRFETPNDVAVDGNDNIYVADNESTLISVFNPDGNFLYYLGTVRGESSFSAVTAIAIDSKRERLYVVDSAVGELIMLDLNGNVLRRLGHAGTPGELQLEHATDVAVWRNEVVVLSRQGSHADILDVDGHPLSSFEIAGTPQMPAHGWLALAIDQHANIYISSMFSASVRIYSHEGKFLSELERRSDMYGMGLWVDSSNRLFVADSSSGEVQVFRIGPAFGAPAPAVQ